MTTAKAIAVVGQLLTLVGAWFVAYELVVRFKGYAYEIKTSTYRGQALPEKTAPFERWEMRRARWMWAGLALITLGTLAQIGAIVIGD